MEGILKGIRVIDFGNATVGPYAPTLMAYLGADVIKIESPEGDSIRYVNGGDPNDTSTYGRNMIANSNTKRFIALNLKEDRDRKIALDLAAKADIIVENFRSADVMDRLGVGYDVVSKINPRIIFLSGSAYGNSGPWKGMGSTDGYSRAASGSTSINGAPGGQGEMLRGIANVDFTAAHINAAAILMALYAREKTGRGQKIYTSQWQSYVVAQTTRIAEYFATGKEPERLGTARPNIVPDQAFPTRDGYINASVIHDGLWPKFCRAIGREELIEDSRFETNQLRVQHRDQLIPLLERVFSGRPSAEWLFRLSQAGVPNGPCLDFMGTTEHPQIRANKYALEIDSQWGLAKISAYPWRFSKNSLEIPTPPSGLDAHRQEILSDWLGAKGAAG